MRLNKYIAQSTGMSRREADRIIGQHRILINGLLATTGQQVTELDQISLDGQPLAQNLQKTTIMLNKPIGYICSRDGQGNSTIYELLPNNLHHLKPVGRLDKNSSGLLLLTNDGDKAHKLTHPSFQKPKTYKIALNLPLKPSDQQIIETTGVKLDDGVSKLQLEPLSISDKTNWKVIMSEGRNRQIRRTFEALGYNVVKLHRTRFGPWQLGSLKPGKFTTLLDT